VDDALVLVCMYGQMGACDGFVALLEVLLRFEYCLVGICSAFVHFVLLFGVVVYVQVCSESSWLEVYISSRVILFMLFCDEG
jgi:hypothetical protein